MKTVAYARPKLVKTAIGCPVLGVAGLMLLGKTGPFMTVVLLVGIAAFFIFGLLGARKLFGDPTALRYDAQRLTVTTMWSEYELRWSDVAEVGTSALNTYALYGLVKVGSTRYLDIKMHGGFLAKKYRLLSDMLDLDKAGLAALVDDLAAHQFAAARAAVPAGAAPAWAAGAPQAEAAFNPDAALANYMRGKSAAGVPAEPTTAPAPGFGRRDSLEGAPQPSLAGTRPGGFGRKGL